MRNWTFSALSSERGGPEGGSYWLLHLESKEVIIPLTGIKGGVSVANSFGVLNLDDGNIADYLKFYCFFDVGEEGPFFIVESIEHPVFDLDQMDRSLRETIESSIQTPQVEWCDGRYEIGASLVYVKSLFQVRFSLLIRSRRCEVVMIQQERLINDIPVKKVDSIY